MQTRIQCRQVSIVALHRPLLLIHLLLDWPQSFHTADLYNANVHLAPEAAATALCAQLPNCFGSTINYFQMSRIHKW